MSEAAAPVDAVQWMCLPCGHVYDPRAGEPESGVAPGTRFEHIDAAYVCPLCGVGKDEFVAI